MEDARSRQFDGRVIELDKPRFACKDDGQLSPEDAEKREKLLAELKTELRKLQA